jgi:hypothetical protein
MERTLVVTRAKQMRMIKHVAERIKSTRPVFMPAATIYLIYQEQK